MLCALALVLACVPLAALAGTSPPRWEIEARGATPYARGLSAGRQLAPQIQAIVHYKLQSTLEYDAPMRALWHGVAAASNDTARLAALVPYAFEELRGLGDGSGVGWDAIFLLATEYELQMRYPGMLSSGGGGSGLKACSGFVAHFPGGSASFPVVAAQSDDEVLKSWQNASGTGAVITYADADGSPREVVFTHPGYSVYMGMNTAGLAPLWQTVADGTHAPGFCIPTQLLMREVLTTTTTASALALVRALPACVSNNLDFTDPTGDLLSVEIAPGGRWATAQAGGDNGAFLAHTNEVWEQRGAVNERSVDPTSIAHGVALRGLLNTTAASPSGGGSLAGIKARYASPPIFAPLYTNEFIRRRRAATMVRSLRIQTSSCGTFFCRGLLQCVRLPVALHQDSIQRCADFRCGAP